MNETPVPQRRRGPCSRRMSRPSASLEDSSRRAGWAQARGGRLLRMLPGRAHARVARLLPVEAALVVLALGLCGARVSSRIEPAAAAGRTGVLQDDTSYYPSYPDYAPSGLPDFSQCRAGWSQPGNPAQWTYAGPVAVANVLWWLDSAAEPNPRSTAEPSDGHGLVTAYPRIGPSYDDHDSVNLPRLVEDLAHRADTDGRRDGTSVRGTAWEELAGSVGRYIADRGLSDDYSVSSASPPDEAWLAAQTAAHAGIVLALGVWERHDGGWRRVGGHYAAVAGVASQRVVLADPLADTAVLTGDGRLVPPEPELHSCRTAPRAHDDAAVVAHDSYFLKTTDYLPDGRPVLEGYFTPASYGEAAAFQGQNPMPALSGLEAEWQGQAVVMALDAAVAIVAVRDPSVTPPTSQSPTPPASTAAPSTPPTTTSPPTSTTQVPTRASDGTPTGTLASTPNASTSSPPDIASPTAASSQPSRAFLPLALQRVRRQTEVSGPATPRWADPSVEATDTRSIATRPSTPRRLQSDEPNLGLRWLARHTRRLGPYRRHRYSRATGGVRAGELEAGVEHREALASRRLVTRNLLSEHGAATFDGDGGEAD